MADMLAAPHEPGPLDPSVQIGPLALKNPLIAASGCFGYGVEYADVVDLSTLGGVVVKGLFLAEREGHPPPRIVETPAGMLNAIGLQGIGVHRFIAEKLPELRDRGAVVIVNICGTTLDEYVEVARILSDAEGVAAIELNISCPNIKAGGITFGCSLTGTADVVGGVKRVTHLPVIPKLTPNVTDVASFARAAEDAGADAVSLVNTFLAMAIDVETRRPRLSNIVGGLSGPAIRPIAVRMVYECRQAVRIPIIGMGGIMTADDVLEFMIAGAAAVQVGTANFVDPFIWPKLAGSERYTPRGMGDLGGMNPSEDECVAVPDPSTLRVLPWDKRVAFFNADLLLRRQGAVRQLPPLDPEVGGGQGGGARPTASCSASRPSSTCTARTRLPDLVPLAPSARCSRPRLRRRADPRLARVPRTWWSSYMEASDFGLFSFDHEGGDGQYELDFAHADGSRQCDRLDLLPAPAPRTPPSSRGAVRHLHAEAGPTAWGSGRPHEHEPRGPRDRREPVRHRARRRPHVDADGHSLRGRGAAPRPGARGADVPDGQLLQAPGAPPGRRQRLVGAGVGGVRRTTTAPACCACRATGRPSRTAAWTWPPTCTSPPRSRSPPGSRASRRSSTRARPVTEDTERRGEPARRPPAPHAARADRRVRGRPAGRTRRCRRTSCPPMWT